MKKIIALFSAALFARPVFTLAHSENGSYQNMMGGWGNMMGWGGMWSGGAWGWLGLVTYLVWLAISVLILIWLFKKVFGKNK